MAALTSTAMPLTGGTITFTAAGAGGDTCTTGRGVLLIVKNDDASSHTVTLVTPGNVSGLAIADREVTVAAGTQVGIPVNADYRNPATGLASITYDGVTSLEVAVIRGLA